MTEDISKRREDICRRKGGGGAIGRKRGRENSKLEKEMTQWLSPLVRDLFAHIFSDSLTN